VQSAHFKVQAAQQMGQPCNGKNQNPCQQPREKINAHFNTNCLGVLKFFIEENLRLKTQGLTYPRYTYTYISYNLYLHFL
jgi:hypothetical protein